MWHPGKLRLSLSVRAELIFVSPWIRLPFPRVFCMAAFVCLITQGLCLSMTQDNKAVTVTERNNGEKISLAQGETLIVKLDAQPGTGYSWQVAKSEPATSLKMLGDSEFELGKDGVAGAVQRQVFNFKAKASGSCVLELHYVRPWEKDAAPAKTYRLEVHVQ